MNWPFDTEPPEPPTRADLQLDERETREREHDARMRQRFERRRAGLPEVEVPTAANGYPF